MASINKGELPREGSEIDDSLKDTVRKGYGKLARRMMVEGGASCCGDSRVNSNPDPVTSDLYLAAQRAAIPSEIFAGSLGCGNPTALAELNPGETVLDLGSGGGIDVLLSARRVGLGGKVFGIDMSDEMLALARHNQRKAGIENAEFLKGEIEDIPLPDGIVDVIISNCVINLSVNKDRALGEAFRVLKPGGRLAVSDIVIRGPMPEDIRRSVELWMGCVAGALEETEYRAKLKNAGFIDVSIEPTRIYDVNDVGQFLAGSGMDIPKVAEMVDNKVMSAFIRAVKGTGAPKGKRSRSG